MNKDREIISTRTFGFPPAKVYDAWTNPELLARWWGPHGFTNTFHTFDLRPGGWWKFTMHGPDGTEFLNECRFVEIVPDERLVFDHIEPVHQFRVTALFQAVGAQTKLTFQMLFEQAEECQRVKAFVVPANEQNFDRLETVLLTS